MNATLQECYEIMQENCGIEVGDEVRVLRKAKNHELGWSNSWIGEMNDVVGKSCIVEKIGPGGGMRLAGDGHGYNYPFFVLEIIEKVKEVTVTMQEVEDKFGYKVKIVEEK